jgi:hypothetical protein
MIDERRYKNAVIVKVVISVVILGVFIFSTIYFGKGKEGYKKQNKKYSSQIRDYKFKLANFNKKTKDINKALPIWERLQEEGKDFKGLKISESRKILEELKVKYNFSKLEVKLSKPELLKKEFKGKVVGVESSNIKISISAYLDVHLFQFIEELKRDFPGYIRINSYSFTLIKEIDEDFLEEMGTKKTTPITAEVDLDWRDLKELVNE